MKEFRGLAVNLMFVEQAKGNLGGLAECIFIYSEPSYRIDDGGEIMRQRVVGEYRLSMGAKSLRTVAKQLTVWAEEIERQEAALKEVRIPEASQ